MVKVPTLELLEVYARRNGIESTYILVCHRSSLAFKSMMNNIPELKHLLSDIVSVSTFYRVSGTRVKELETCAHYIDAKYKVYHWPQFKEVGTIYSFLKF